MEHLNRNSKLKVNTEIKCVVRILNIEMKKMIDVVREIEFRSYAKLSQ